MNIRRFFKLLGMILAGVIIILCVGYLFLPKGPRETMEFDDPYRTERTQAESDHYMASTGTPWATETALKIMKEGGNAYDAAMAAMLSLNVTFNSLQSGSEFSKCCAYSYV